MFTNIRINVTSQFCDEFSYFVYCLKYERSCKIKNITIDKKDIHYREFILIPLFCEAEDHI